MNVVDDPGKQSNRKEMLKHAARTTCTVTVLIVLPALTRTTQSAVLLLVVLSNFPEFCSTTAYFSIQKHKDRILHFRTVLQFNAFLLYFAVRRVLIAVHSVLTRNRSLFAEFYCDSLRYAENLNSGKALGVASVLGGGDDHEPAAVALVIITTTCVVTFTHGWH